MIPAKITWIVQCRLKIHADSWTVPWEELVDVKEHDEALRIANVVRKMTDKWEVTLVQHFNGENHE